MGDPQHANGSGIAFVTHTRPYSAGDVLAALARSGFTTTERPHDHETSRLVKALTPDVLFLAVDPGRSADVELIREMARFDAGMVVLAPGSDPSSHSAALAAGADLCLRDSDGADLITAQLHALLRRLRPAEPLPQAEGSVIVIRDISLDFDRCQAIRDGDVLPLTPTEFKILAHLAKNAGRVISPVEILRAVREYTYTEREAQEIVKVSVRRIRRKVEHDPSDPTYVINVRGFGYMLERSVRSGHRHVAA